MSFNILFVFKSAKKALGYAFNLFFFEITENNICTHAKPWRHHNQALGFRNVLWLPPVNPASEVCQHLHICLWEHSLWLKLFTHLQIFRSGLGIWLYLDLALNPLKQSFENKGLLMAYRKKIVCWGYLKCLNIRSVVQYNNK